MNTEMRFFGTGYGRCTYCESSLDVHEQIKGFCAKPECLQKAGLQAEQEKMAQRKADLQALVTRMLESLPDRGIGDAITAVITPSNDGKVARLPAHRLEAFGEHLSALFSRIVESSQSRANIEYEHLELIGSGSEANSIFALACGHCRGHCCRQGNRANAFISEETIRHQLSQMNEQSPQELLQEYISLIPNFTFENSCVYHGKSGCALPRSMRSNTCNNFYCEHLHMVDTDKATTAKKILFVAEENYQPVRSNLIVTDA